MPGTPGTEVAAAILVEVMGRVATAKEEGGTAVLMA